MIVDFVVCHILTRSLRSLALVRRITDAGRIPGSAAVDRYLLPAPVLRQTGCTSLLPTG